MFHVQTVDLYVFQLCLPGECCNLQTCSMKPKYTLCRPTQDSECDTEEFCDGSSEWCPLDTYKRDGTPCYNRGDAYCYDGKCNSHNSQCYLIWNKPSARKSDDLCYSFNKNGE